MVKDAMESVYTLQSHLRPRNVHGVTGSVTSTR